MLRESHALPIAKQCCCFVALHQVFLELNPRPLWHLQASVLCSSLRLHSTLTISWRTSTDRQMACARLSSTHCHDDMRFILAAPISPLRSLMEALYAVDTLPGTFPAPCKRCYFFHVIYAEWNTIDLVNRGSTGLSKGYTQGYHDGAGHCVTSA